jgi:hypothetical protein
MIMRCECAHEAGVRQPYLRRIPRWPVEEVHIKVVGTKTPQRAVAVPSNVGGSHIIAASNFRSNHKFLASRFVLHARGKFGGIGAALELLGALVHERAYVCVRVCMCLCMCLFVFISVCVCMCAQVRKCGRAKMGACISV